MPEGRGLFEVARERMRTRHLALRTEQAYLQWMRRYVKFHNRRHPRDMGPAEVKAFLTHLAVDGKVGASTQIRRSRHCCFSIGKCLASNCRGSTT